jgi:hypothetical protein
MGGKPTDLRPSKTPLCGFNGHTTYPEGVTNLPVTLGTPPRSATFIATFVVIRGLTSYNAIFGRGIISRARGVPSTYHQKMKFPTPCGVGEVRGDQQEARRCYLVSVQPSESEKGTPERKVAQEDRPASLPGDDLLHVNLQNDPEYKVRIGASLPPGEQARYQDFLSSYIDVFAWTDGDLPGIPEEVATHHLNLNPEVRPVQQKRRKQAAIRQLAIKEQVSQGRETGLFREVQYPTWLANPVLVPKANGKWRMCVDFTDLNKATAKDCYPLPSIDQLVDSITGSKALNFLDAHSGYHQIRMHPADAEKTAFITDFGVFCYTRMPFGLKNVGVTYQ